MCEMQYCRATRPRYHATKHPCSETSQFNRSTQETSQLIQTRKPDSNKGKVQTWILTPMYQFTIPPMQFYAQLQNTNFLYKTTYTRNLFYTFQNTPTQTRKKHLAANLENVFLASTNLSANHCTLSANHPSEGSSVQGINFYTMV